MKIKNQYKIVVLLVFVNLHFVQAQKKEENIGTEVVNVVKPYTPTISDAFKVKETPSMQDEDNSKKEIINYSIFSFPVASTFTPSKGKAAGVDKSKQEQLYKNYLTVGLGNYLNVFAELYVTEDVSDSDYIAGMVKYLSSNGGIKNIETNNNFLNSSIDLTYGSKQRDYSWKADLGYQLQKYFWYGLPDSFPLNLTNDEKFKVFDDLNQSQTYNNFNIGGRIHFNESVFDDINLKYNRFSDAFGSSENRFIVKPTLKFDLFDKTIKTELFVDHVSGGFDKAYNSIVPIKYNNTNLGIRPTFALNKDDWSFKVGATLSYNMDSENNNNKLFVYPHINASLKVVGDLMVFYLGAEGNLQQNSYRDFTNINPFLSPTTIIAPTNQQYDLFAGLKGKLSNYISYNVKGSLIDERNKSLFKSNDYNSDSVLNKVSYQYGNSFGIVYDDIKTITFHGELKGDFSKNISVGINGTFNKYSTLAQQEAWNLPEIQFGANLDVAITTKWFAGANVFFVGERKDQQINFDILPIVPLNNTKTLKSYFDLNANLGYKYSERFTAFLRLNNIANQGYQRWLNFPVQSFQIMAGLNYKFDF